jgi:hypothetical protein
MKRIQQRSKEEWALHKRINKPSHNWAHLASIEKNSHDKIMMKGS